MAEADLLPYIPSCGRLNRDIQDNAWLYSSAFLILSMQAGFGMVEAGCVSKKNNVNIMMKNMADMVVGGLSFYFIGYPIAFTLLSWQWEFEPQDSAHWFFQFSFAATASTIDSGAVAERISFGPYIVISALTAGFIYPMCAWAVWNEDGFLYQLGFVDFAGGAAIHALGGMGALVLIFILGPRIGRFKDYKPSQRRLFQPLCQRPADPLYYQVGTHRESMQTRNGSACRP